MREILALIASFFAAVSVGTAYFMKKKSEYLFFQSACLVFLILSYLFNAQYFAMIGVTIGLLRTLAYYAYEQKDRVAPLFVPIVAVGLTFTSYFIVNYGILKTAQPLDILCLLSLVGYAVIFRIRNMKLVRFLAFIPIILALLFNTLTRAPIFASVTYIIELTANVISIYQYYIQPKKETEEETNENG